MATSRSSSRPPGRSTDFKAHASARMAGEALLVVWLPPEVAPLLEGMARSVTGLDTCLTGAAGRWELVGLASSAE